MRAAVRGGDGMKITDETLYRRYLSGDEGGLHELMERYSRALTLYITGYVHDPHDAEDLLIEVFSYLITKQPRIRDGGFKAYLYKAARSYALRFAEKRRRHIHFGLEDMEDELESAELIEVVVQTQERNRILHLCMEQMHLDYREVLYLLYFEDMSYKEAAEVMGKSEKQVTALVHRGKQSLRKLLEQEGITDAYNG